MEGVVTATKAQSPIIRASVDMCGLVTDARDLEDARAEAARSCITEEDSLMYMARTAAKASSSLQDNDPYALSSVSVASWLSSSVKEATITHAIMDIPSSIVHPQNPQTYDENNVVPENDDDDDDESIANMSLASLISSIGYMSTGSQKSKLLQLPAESLLDDISTTSVEMIFADDASITPSLNGDDGTTTLLVPLTLDKDEHDDDGDDAPIIVNASQEGPSQQSQPAAAEPTIFPQKLMNLLLDSRHKDTITFLPDGQHFCLSTNEFQKVLPTIELTCIQELFHQLDAYGFTQVKKDESSGIVVYSHSQFRRDDPEGAKIIPLRQTTATPPLPAAAVAATADSSCLVYENNGQDGWGSDNDSDHDIESGKSNHKPTTTKKNPTSSTSDSTDLAAPTTLEESSTPKQDLEAPVTIPINDEGESSQQQIDTVEAPLPPMALENDTITPSIDKELAMTTKESDLESQNTQLDTSTETASTLQQSYEEDEEQGDSSCIMDPNKAKLDALSDTELTTTQQSHEDSEDDDIAIGEPNKKIPIPFLCQKHGSKLFLYGAALLVALICLWIALSSSSGSDNDDTASFAMEAVSASPSLSVVPSMEPSSSMLPSFIPSDQPSNSLLPSTMPSDMPSMTPSHRPSAIPSASPSHLPTYEELETVFHAIGDVPYNNREKTELRERLRSMQTQGEFLIHLGDMRSVQNPNAPCRREEFLEVRDILLESKVPVFIIPGDNEWTDCPNKEQGQAYWREAFKDFEQNWNHPFQVHRDSNRPENFHFVHKRTIYFGLNIVGGDILDRQIFAAYLTEQFEWVKEMLDQHVVDNDTLSVVIFGHAFPRMVHQAFFAPLKRYIQDVLKDDIPVMYLNGDYHFYEFEQRFMGLDNMQRLQVDFGTVNPPLKVAVAVSANPTWEQTFSHDRMI